MVAVDTDKIIRSHHRPVFANNALIGALLKSINLDVEAAYNVFDAHFKNSSELKKIIKFGYFLK